MTQGKITASAAMLNVLKTWGVDTIYGIPSGTLSSLMDALAEDKDIRFLQVSSRRKLVLLQRFMQAKIWWLYRGCSWFRWTWCDSLDQRCFTMQLWITLHSLPFLDHVQTNELNMDAFQEIEPKPNVQRYRCLQQNV